MRTQRYPALVVTVLALLLFSLAVATAYGDPDEQGPASSQASSEPEATPSPEPSETEAQNETVPPEEGRGETGEGEGSGSEPEATQEGSEELAVQEDTETPVEETEVEETEVEEADDEDVEAHVPGDEETSLRLEASSGDSLATVGDNVDYTIQVHNPGPLGLQNVTVEVDLAAELEAASVGGEVDGQVLEDGALWEIPVLEPGETLELDLLARVVGEGTLHAESRVMANGQGVGRETADLDTYIGALRGRAVTNPEPEIFRKVSFLRPREVTVRLPEGSTALPSVLPATGVPVGLPLGLLLALGVALLTAGGLVLARAGGLIRGTAARSAVLLLLVLTACTADVERPGQEAAGPTPTEAAAPTEGDEADEPEEDEGDDEVKGSLITRDDEGETDSGSDEADGGDGSSDPATGSEPAGTAAEPTTQTVIVYDEVTRTQKVPTSQIPVRALGSQDGDNAISLDWSGTDVITQTSSVSFTPDATATLMTTQRESGDALVAEVTLTNELAGERLAVQGRFVHEVSGGGFSGTLSSEPIDVVLNPNGTTTYTFNYALPQGSYAVSSRFEAS